MVSPPQTVTVRGGDFVGKGAESDVGFGVVQKKRLFFGKKGWFVKSSTMMMWIVHGEFLCYNQEN